ncbi:MAG: CocE/NonD family hydrolase [Alphaproteobacteria bacterium]
MNDPGPPAANIREIENVWIPLPDGTRLAARLFLPGDAEARPVPAILEYLPYRKRDLMRARDEPIHRWFAANGYAAVRVDIRGTGDSDGVLADEYSREEHRDAVDVIAWIAAQPWCSGRVGMMGISWGGFNALQVAALRPPALGAIITLCAADDRFADDAHYMGGCLLNENMQWGSILTGYGIYPPDPALVGDRWRDMWRQRLEATRPFPAVWLEHQRRDAYWRYGSVCEDFAAIKVPVYAIGGWADGYSNAVPRLLAGLSCPKKGLVGPWAHTFPHDGVPSPAIGFLQEAKRWWDHWLRDVDTGLMDEPAYRVWMQASVPPQPTYESRPGRWVAEDGWPSPRVAPLTLHLAPWQLATSPQPDAVQELCSPQTTGVNSGEWCAFGTDGEMPTDQRADDGRSLTFDSAPLDAPLDILGAPEVTLDIACDRPVALIAVRLCDVAPDGASTRVTYGLLNLTRRDGMEAAAPLHPGERVRVTVALNHIAHAFPAGNVVRLAVSTSYWPIAWPSPEPATIALATGGSTLTLPVRPPRDADAALRAFEPPERGSGEDPTRLRPLRFVRQYGRDLTTNEMLHSLVSDAGELGGASLARIEAIDLEVGYRMERRFRIGETDPLTARAEILQERLFARGDWRVRVSLRTRLTATRRTFEFLGVLDAFEGDARIFEKRWTLSIPRDLM